MSILRISNELGGVVSTFSKSVNSLRQKDIDRSVKDNHHFSIIFDNVNKILLKNDYVIIKNIGFSRDRRIFESFIKLFGTFYGDSIEFASIKTECNYTACNYGLIELHNDDMIALDKIPKYGFIQVVNEDPLRLAKNGIVKISEVAEYLKIYNPNLLNDLLVTKIPMMTYGINYNDKNKKWVSINETILYETENHLYNVRFDLGAIKTYYWQHKEKQSSKEQKLIKDFLKVCKKIRREYYLEAGDILIHNNTVALHDRTSSAIELNIDGSLNSREIFVGFTQNG